MKKAEHEITHYPSSRIGTIDLGKIGLHKHHVAGLLEIDVTKALENIKKRRAKGKKTSFTSWIMKSISTVLSDNRYAHAMMGRNNTLVIFNDIDISMPVEREVQGTRVPLALLIKKTNEKSEEEIYLEIQKACSKEIRDESDFVISESRLSKRTMRLYYMLPQKVRVFLLKRILNNPFRTKEMMGTVIVTTIGTVGRLSGWIIPKSMHNLCFALGSIVKKPWVVENEIEIRDILHMTVLFDHDVVDGAPATRFIMRLVDRIQKGI
jgi:pyruvate/2-oxoglutarate dehydrogenase complex dihydrolipoamide acyltransferase (E2) component